MQNSEDSWNNYGDIAPLYSYLILATRLLLISELCLHNVQL